MKTNLCLETFIQHDSESKVWALESWEDGRLLVTGGEDGRFVVWKDVTEETVRLKAQETER